MSTFNEKRETIPDQEIDNGTNADVSATDENSTGILSSAKRVVNEALGFTDDDDNTSAAQHTGVNSTTSFKNHPVESSEIPQEGLASKASQGISNAFAKAGGANSQVSGNYKKVGTTTLNTTSGNVIEPNDNRNVKYTSMVDAVLTPEEAAEAQRVAKHKGVITDPLVGSNGPGVHLASKMAGKPIPASSNTKTSNVASQPVGAVNAMKENHSVSGSHSGARVDHVPTSSLPVKHNDDYYDEPEQEDGKSAKTGKSAASGGIFGGIIGTVTGHSNSDTSATAHDEKDSSLLTSQNKNTTTTTTTTTTGAGAGAESNPESVVYKDREADSSASSNYEDSKELNNTGRLESRTTQTSTGGGILGGILGAVTGKSASNAAPTEEGFSNQASQTADDREFTTGDKSGEMKHSSITTDDTNQEVDVPGSFPQSGKANTVNTNSTSQQAEFGANGQDGNANNNNPDVKSTAAGAAGAAGGGVIGGLLAKVIGHGSTTQEGERTTVDDDVNSNPQYGGAGAPSNTLGSTGAGAPSNTLGSTGAGAPSNTLGSTGAMKTQREQENSQIHDIDYEISAVETKIKKIELEVDALRSGAQNKINSEEHKYTKSNHEGGAALVGEKLKINSADTKRYGLQEQELSDIRAKQANASQRLQELELERLQVANHADEINLRLQKIEKSVGLQTRDIEQLSRLNYQNYIDSESSRSLKQEPVQTKTLGGSDDKKLLEVGLLEDRIARLKIQSQDLDRKIKDGSDQYSTSGGVGKMEKGYNDQSMSANYPTTGGVGKMEKGYNDQSLSGNQGLAAGAVAGGAMAGGIGAQSQGVKSSHVAAAPQQQRVGQQQPHKFPQTLRSALPGVQTTSKKSVESNKGNHSGEAAAAAAASAAASTGYPTARGYAASSAVPHSVKDSTRRKSFHEAAENSVYPEHESTAQLGPTEKLITGSGVASTQHRQPYGVAHSNEEDHHQKEHHHEQQHHHQQEQPHLLHGGAAAGRHIVGPPGAPNDPSYVTGVEDSHIHPYSHGAATSGHVVGPPGAPTDPSYSTGRGDEYRKTAATDSVNNDFARSAGAGGTNGVPVSKLHSHHQNRAGPSGAPFDPEYTDHESSYYNDQKTEKYVGPPGAPDDSSFITGGSGHSRSHSHVNLNTTAATDSSHNIGKHQASAYPNDSVSHTKSSGGPLGAGAVGGASTASTTSTTSTESSKSSGSSLKSKMQHLFGKNHNKSDQKLQKGQQHGTTYEDPKYNSKAYSGVDNTGDENLGDPQHPNTQKMGGTRGTIGGGIVSPEERDRYQVAQGEKSAPGHQGYSSSLDPSKGGRGEDYSNLQQAPGQTGHGMGTKIDPRTGRDVTGSSGEAEKLNTAAVIGGGAAAGTAAASGGVVPGTTGASNSSSGTRNKPSGGANDDYIDIKVVGAHDKAEAAAIATAVIKENRREQGTFSSKEVVVDADKFKQQRGANFTETFNDSDKAVVEQMEHVAGVNHDSLA